MSVQVVQSSNSMRESIKCEFNEIRHNSAKMSSNNRSLETAANSYHASRKVQFSRGITVSVLQELQRDRAQLELLQLSKTKPTDTSEQDQRQAKSVVLGNSTHLMVVSKNALLFNVMCIDVYA